MRLCDLHTHVLPGVDDGAPTMEYALQMLQNAAASDVQLVAATPHCNGFYENYMDQSLKSCFLQLQQAAKEIPVQLVLGAEVRVSDDLPALLQRAVLPTLNGSRYLLTEFAPDHPADAFEPVLQSICSEGVIPLIAHPERYSAVCKEPELVFPWLDMGCHLQLTGGSVMGEYGRTIQRTAGILLQRDLVACIASDAHGVNFRSNYLMDVYDHLSVQYSRQYAACLMYENPLRICQNDDL